MRRGQKTFRFEAENGTLVKLDSLHLAAKLVGDGWRELTRSDYRQKRKKLAAVRLDAFDKRT